MTQAFVIYKTSYYQDRDTNTLSSSLPPLCALLSYILTTPSGRPGSKTDRQGRIPLRVPLFSIYYEKAYHTRATNTTISPYSNNITGSKALTP
jgi:hypothetical protein